LTRRSCDEDYISAKDEIGGSGLSSQGDSIWGVKKGLARLRRLHERGESIKYNIFSIF
jgi:hypothetical protein